MLAAVNTLCQFVNISASLSLYIELHLIMVINVDLCTRELIMRYKMEHEVDMRTNSGSS